MPLLRKLVVVGVGLIGGSFALALRKAGAVGRVIGVGRTAATLSEAKQLGIIDEAANGFVCAGDADMVMLAMPVGQTRALMRALAPHLGDGTVVTDAGSTKCDVVAAARAELVAALPRFVPGHPIAGTEHSGPRAAFSGLFHERKVVLTPLPETSARALARVRAAWKACGARVSMLSPEDHDRLLAAVSHLPHLLAFALVDLVARHDAAAQLFSFAAGGFRDFTRIASSHPEMWRDICLANREALLAELARYEDKLGEVRRALQSSDGAAIEAVFARAREARQRWLEAETSNGGSAERDLSS